ncbi:MAG TPA: hypothetical protein VK324_08630 [Tepidisphaeraceae bacterium]|nr:hypothetical protein [Tepidisphaeraceae bacterium]
MASRLALLNPVRLFLPFRFPDYALVAVGVLMVFVSVVAFYSPALLARLVGDLPARGGSDPVRAAFYGTFPVGLGLIGFPFCRRSSASQMMSWSLMGLLFMVGFAWVAITDAMGQERGVWGPFSFADLMGMCGGFAVAFVVMFVGLLMSPAMRRA